MKSAKAKPAADVDPLRLLRPDDVARLLGLTRRTVTRWRVNGTLPPARQIGPAVVGWLSRDIEAWLRTRPFVKGEDRP